ncbi:MAG: hypothetical protein RLY87_2148 [Chloroflexota bacterium]
MNTHFSRSLVVSALLMLSACGSALNYTPHAGPFIPVDVVSTPFNPASQPCNTTFTRTDLPHLTAGEPGGSALYASNGSGVAVGDLNGDQRPDLVFGNITGTVTIFVNDGNFAFHPVSTTLDDVRSLAIVDSNGDGTRELVATRRFAPPIIGTFQNDALTYALIPGVYGAFYAMGWQDLDANGTLELVLGSYDNEQLQQQGLIFTTRGGGGVFVYSDSNGTFVGNRLNQRAQALAIIFPDLNHDGRADILVGNDFNEPDAAWNVTTDGYTAVAPFSQTTENTMSLDYADTDNNGFLDIYATDMKPYAQDVTTMAQWLPAMKKLTRPLSADDPQYTENTLHTWDGTRWKNTAYDLQLDATGWSWSATFADLDNNGWQDLYVVNGMKATDLLNYLPNGELVEDDMLFETADGVTYTRSDRGLLNTGSGRAASMADLDNDGDLDVVVNPIDGPAQLYRNNQCGGQSVTITLVDPTSANRDAIGAVVHLATPTGMQTRSVQVSGGYLSGRPTTVHFGLAAATSASSLDIRWPDGTHSTVPMLQSGSHYQITRKAAP